MRRRKRKIKVIPVLFLIFIIVLLIVIGYKISRPSKKINNSKTTHKISLKLIRDKYNMYVSSTKNIKLYDKEKKEVGLIEKGSNIILDDSYEISNQYFKLKDEDLYIKYNSLKKEEAFSYNDEYKTFINYIPFNIKIITKDNYKLKIEDRIIYEINSSDTYDVYIKDDNRYGIKFNGQLYYIDVDDILNYEDVETNQDYTDNIAVLNYHYTIDEKSDEGLECRQTICMTETQVDEEIKYLKDNNFYSVTMEDLYLFLTSKIRLPKKSVAITIDDGWYLARMITILEKYQMHGTLYLIGSLASPSDYTSDYLEIHSHTWDMHKLNVCPGSHHGGGLLCLDENVILQDLKKSRESLNNTEVFCYPFYEYNERAINLLKQAGFKMALAGGSRKAKPGEDLFEIPRYELSNSTSINYFKNIVN